MCLSDRAPPRCGRVLRHQYCYHLAWPRPNRARFLETNIALIWPDPTPMQPVFGDQYCFHLAGPLPNGARFRVNNCFNLSGPRAIWARFRVINIASIWPGPGPIWPGFERPILLQSNRAPLQWGRVLRGRYCFNLAGPRPNGARL